MHPQAARRDHGVLRATSLKLQPVRAALLAPGRVHGVARVRDELLCATERTRDVVTAVEVTEVIGDLNGLLEGGFGEPQRAVQSLEGGLIHLTRHADMMRRK